MASLIMGVIIKWLLNKESEVYEEISSVVGVEIVLFATARSDLFAAALFAFSLFWLTRELEVGEGCIELDEDSDDDELEEDLLGSLAGLGNYIKIMN